MVPINATRYAVSYYSSNGSNVHVAALDNLFLRNTTKLTTSKVSLN